MNISGKFGTASSAEALRRLGDAPGTLAHVSTLDEVEVDADGVIRARFSPETALGPLVLRIRIDVIARDERGARLRVVGQHGGHVVDVDLVLGFTSGAEGGEISWEADLVVRGPMASVGQRVAQDLVERAVSEVLREAAEVAGQPV